MIPPGIYDNRRLGCREEYAVLRSGEPAVLVAFLTRDSIERAIKAGEPIPGFAGTGPWGSFPDVPRTVDASER